ncbi:MAG: hypothetical protein ABL998_23125, partial [Planctomycetota bacterium]
RPLDFDLPEASDGALRVVLARDAGALLLSGWVLGPTGEPFGGARVSAGGEFVTSGADGSFALAAPAETGRFVQDEKGVFEPEVRTRVRLFALAPGFAPAALEFARTEVPDELVLELAGEPLTITGSVRDSAGQGLAGVVVWPRELTGFARNPRMEGFGRELTVEEELCESSGWFGTVTEEDGGFTLGCLAERTYELEFCEGRTATCLTLAEVAAGTRGLAVVLAPEPRTRRVAGRIVDGRGTPRAGIEVHPRRTRADGSWIDPPALVQSWCETDAEGRFIFEELAIDGTVLYLQTMQPQAVDLADQADLELLEIVSPLLCELQVLLSNPALADSVGVFDDKGTGLQVTERIRMDSKSVTWMTDERAQFSDGRTSVIQVPDTARTLVLFLGDVRVLERPLTLDPGAPTVLRY